MSDFETNEGKQPVRVRIDTQGLPEEAAAVFSEHATELCERVEAELRLLEDDAWIDERLTEVVIAGNLEATLAAISSEWGLPAPSVTREKEFSGHSRVLERKDPTDEAIIVIDWVAATPLLSSVLVGQAMPLVIERRLPERYRTDKGWSSATSIHDILPVFLESWIPRVATFAELKRRTLLDENPDADTPFVETFMRRIKDVHYAYQKHKSIDQLRVDAISAVRDVVSWGIHAYYDGANFSGTGDVGVAVRQVIECVVELSNAVLSGSPCDEGSIVEVIDNLLALCSMSLDPSSESGRRIPGLIITENPKLLFKRELVDTEPRFVAFLDILGFQAMIEDYDADARSNVLKILKNALEEAVQKATRRAKRVEESNSLWKATWGPDPFYEDFENLLGFRMFSDCFCISLPYFESVQDFAMQFASLVTTVRVFVHRLVKQHFFIRGGLASGSYYSDDNILFSGALVKAFRIEHYVAKMPRVVISDDIVEQIKRSNVVLRYVLGMTHSLVRDKIDNIVFVNPVGIDQSINISVSDLLENIEELYDALGIDRNRYQLLINMLRGMQGIFPNLDSLVPGLKPPQDIAENIDPIDVDVLIEELEADIQRLKPTCKCAIEGKDCPACSIVKKYEWLCEFLRWWSSGGEDGGRFEYVV